MSTILTNPILSIRATATLSSGTFPVLNSNLNHTPSTPLSVGNAVGQVDIAVEKSFTVTSGTPFTYNVSTGLDPFGATAGMVHVSAVIVENDSTTGGQTMTIGGGTHSVLGSDSYTAQPNGGVVAIVNPNPGYVVAGGSTDTITISVASGTAVAGKLTILGRSA